MAEEDKNITNDQSEVDTSNVNEEEETEEKEEHGTKEDTSIGLTKIHESATLGLNEISESSSFLSIGDEKGLINGKTKSSIVIRQNGQINLAATRYSQYKLNPSGKAMEESLESVTVTNRKKFSVDDMVINEHKINPFLYELTDMKDISRHDNDHMLVGNFTVLGTVLVKAWDPELKRYVLIRRLARMPMFSPLLNVPEISKGLNISDPLKVDHNILAKSTKGYQVNKPMHDSASLIGKDGVDRAGINRNAGIGVSENPATLGANNSIANKAGLSGGGLIDITTPTGVTAAKINLLFNGKLAGTGDLFIAAGKKYGIDPAAIAAIACQETGHGESDAAMELNNFGGLMASGGGLLRFGSVQEGIDTLAKWLHNYVVEDGEKYLGQIKLSWCPDGAANDPNGLNKDWLPNVTQFYVELGGKIPSK